MGLLLFRASRGRPGLGRWPGAAPGDAVTAVGVTLQRRSEQPARRRSCTIACISRTHTCFRPLQHDDNAFSPAAFAATLARVPHIRAFSFARFWNAAFGHGVRPVHTPSGSRVLSRSGCDIPRAARRRIMLHNASNLVPHMCKCRCASRHQSRPPQTMHSQPRERRASRRRTGGRALLPVAKTPHPDVRLRGPQRPQHNRCRCDPRRSRRAQTSFSHQ